MEVHLPTLVQTLEQKLKKAPFTSRVFLDRLRLISEDSRKTAAYADHRYAPFYFYLGDQIEPKSMVEIGFRLGLLSSCFFRGCKTVESFLAFHGRKKDVFYSPRLAIANVKDYYKKDLDVYTGQWLDDEWADKYNSREWDLILINDETIYDKHSAYLDFIWPKLSLNGLIVMDYVSFHKPAHDAYFNFCKVRNREPVVINTRYGVGMVQK